MKEEIARAIAELTDDEGEDIRLRDDYSGRCMYGETTFGLVCTSLQDL